jgi:adenosylcobinamide-GDP ribazoletransferase
MEKATINTIRRFAMINNHGNRHHLLQGLLSAVRFLTIIPCPGRFSFDARSALPYFPLCGLAIGLTVVLVDAVASSIWPRPLTAMINIVALEMISGALHLDGLADTADGLYGHRQPDQALSIMKDSRVGAMGLVAVVCIIGLKWGALAAMGSSAGIWLLIVPGYARCAALIGIRMLPYGRPSGGTGQAFFDPPLQFKNFWGLGLLIPLSFFTGVGFIGLNVGFVLIVFAVLGYYRRKINCITGDMLGALIEVTETGLFLIAAAHWSA